jgi:enoyl-CoA hydratase/carnithine racemase
MNINVEVKNGVRHIIINRPEKRNALTRDMFTSIMTSLNDANEDDSTVIVALRGVGDYFTSGMDMTPSKKPNSTESDNKTDGKKNRFREDFVKFHSSFVQCKKPLMALVNGPTIGVRHDF